MITLLAIELEKNPLLVYLFFFELFLPPVMIIMFGIIDKIKAVLYNYKITHRMKKRS